MSITIPQQESRHFPEGTRVRVLVHTQVPGEPLRVTELSDLLGVMVVGINPPDAKASCTTVFHLNRESFLRLDYALREIMVALTRHFL